jgi:hypothetical protein
MKTQHLSFIIHHFKKWREGTKHTGILYEGVFLNRTNASKSFQRCGAGIFTF